MKLYDAKTSFASGELSPALWGRIDLDQYRTGARTIQNFIVLPQGGLVNRPGTTTLGDKSYSAYASVRLVPFVFSEEDSCVLAFSNFYVDRYTKDGLQETIENSPYSRLHLKKLRWLQSADVLYLFHPDVPVHTLSRTANGWVFNEVEFENGPFEDLNTDPARTLEIIQTGALWMTMRSSFDMTGMMYTGQLFRIEAEVKAYSESISVERKSETDFGPWFGVTRPVFGAFTYRTSGKWRGTLEVQRRRPGLTWEDFKTHTSEKDAEENFSFSGDVEEYANSYRFRYKGNTDALTVNFNFEGGLVNRVFQVRSFSQTNGVITEAAVRDTDGNTESIAATDAWAVGSFGPKYGYPSMGIFHQERLVLANTRHSPQTLWMSQPASWHNFGVSVPSKDDDSITVTLASKEVNEIRGLASRGDLLIFTAGGEWVAKAGSKSDVFTPGSIIITPAGYRGSADIAPLDVGNVTLFVQRQGTTVRSAGYSLDIDGYSSQDISILAAHIFQNNPVTAWAYQQTPWSVVWCVLNDGTMAALTIQNEHQVNAWTRQTFPGKTLDVCVIPGDIQDDVFLVQRRGSSAWRVLLLNRRDTQSGTFTDLGDFPVHSILECLDWEQTIQDGTLQGRHKHIPAMTLRLLDMQALKGGVITENSTKLDELSIPGTPYSGDVRLLPPGGTGRICRVRLENDTAGPVTILGIFPEVVVPPAVTTTENT